jgi:hypothetical protein
VRHGHPSLFEPGPDPGPERPELPRQLLEHAGHVGGNARQHERQKQDQGAERPAEHDGDARRTGHVPGFEPVHHGIQDVGDDEGEQDRGEHVAQPIHDRADDQDRGSDVEPSGQNDLTALDFHERLPPGTLHVECMGPHLP